MKTKPIYFSLFLAFPFFLLSFSPADPPKDQKILSIAGNTLSRLMVEEVLKNRNITETACAKSMTLYDMTMFYSLDHIAKKQKLAFPFETIESNGAERITASSTIDFPRITAQQYQLLRQHFYWNPDFHQKALQEAQSFFRQLSQVPDSSMAVAAPQYYILQPKALHFQGLDRTCNPVHYKMPAAPLALEHGYDFQPENQNFQALYQILVKSRAKEFYPAILETEREFCLLGVKEMDAQGLHLLVWSFPKENFSEWLRQEMSEVQVNIHDPSSWEKMKACFPYAGTSFPSTIIARE